MSRIGRAPIQIPQGVQITIDGTMVTVKGPKGEMKRQLPSRMQIEMQDGTLLVKRPTDNNQDRSLHGLTRTLLANMVTGVTQGFEKKIEIYGVGYRAQKQGNKLMMQLGYSHPVEMVPPEGISLSDVETFTPTSGNEWLSSRFSILGIDKEKVGEFAAEVRSARAVEPYKGKGIKYAGERVRRKAGKTGAKGKGGK